MAVPAVMAIGAFFMPEIKKSYTDLSKEKKDTYRAAALTGSTLLGAVVSIVSGYNLFKTRNKEE